MKLQKIASLILALIMIFSLGITAFAEENAIANDEPELGSITINGVSAETTYEIYKLLDLESYNKETKVYSYKINAEWDDFFATDAAKAYFSVDAQGYATWTNPSTSDETAAAFAKIALAYAQENDIAPVKSSKNDGEMSIIKAGAEGNSTDKDIGVFSDLALGYYLVDSNVGALCGLTTTNPDASVNAKNGVPSIEKQVKEDSTGNWGSNNTADIGQTVEFLVTINVHAGAENFVLHDVMGEGFTFQSVSKIEHVVPSTGDTHEVPTGKYNVVTEGIDDTFDIVFTPEFCNDLKVNDKVLVYYSAMLNRDAVINGAGNINKASLTFGTGNHRTAESQTVTKTFSVDIVKTDSQNTLINGAEFRIYDAAVGGNEIKFVLTDDGDAYRRARDDEAGANIVVENGLVKVLGFDNGDYYLEEVVSPEGYNKLAERKHFVISDGNLDATFNNNIYSTGSGVHVVNKAGTMLPETGGVGTTMFYVVGGLLVGGAVVALVSKKRMSSK